MTIRGNDCVKMRPIFENIYDKHSAPLYGIILKISQNTNEAEEILIQSFKTFFLQNIAPVNTPRIFLQLLQIAIRIASEKKNASKQIIETKILKELNRLQAV